MGLMRDDSSRAAREAMEQAAGRSRREFGEGAADGSPKPSRPRRYKLYDRIASRVPLNAINIVIAVTSLLLIAALVYGILTANPQN